MFLELENKKKSVLIILKDRQKFQELTLLGMG